MERDCHPFKLITEENQTLWQLANDLVMVLYKQGISVSEPKYLIENPEKKKSWVFYDRFYLHVMHCNKAYTLKYEMLTEESTRGYKKRPSYITVWDGHIDQNLFSTIRSRRVRSPKSIF